MSTPEEKVNEVLDKMTQVDGNWTLPDGVDPVLGYAAMAERRRRDTQAAYTKSQQELITARKESDLVFEELSASLTPELSEEDRANLEELKTTDPEKWRKELNRLEAETKASSTSKREAFKSKAKEETEVERRKRLLDEHNAAHPEHQLTDEVIDNDLPPRFLKRVESGEASWEDFLSDAHGFLSKGKVVKQEESDASTETSLGGVAGGSAPESEALKQEGANQYKDDIY